MVQKSQYFITLFFLPVLPYKTEFTEYCPICNKGQYLSKDVFEAKLKDQHIEKIAD